MKRIYYIMAALLFCVASVSAQVRIGNATDPHKGAILDLQSTETKDMGVLFPHVTLTSLTSFAPVGEDEDAIEGMVVYNADGALGKGLYVWDSEKWVMVSEDASGGGEESATETPKVSISSDLTKGAITTSSPVTLMVELANPETVGSVEYRWYKNGNEAEVLATTETYIIETSKFDVRDYYTCVVSNNEGSKATGWAATGANTDSEWLMFMPYNLGVTNKNADPFTYSADINGDLYQWGRVADGHQIRTSDDVDGPVADTHLSDNQVSSTATDYYGKFIYDAGSPYDWRATQNTALWGATKTEHDPCPEGWKVPTGDQWNAVITYNKAIIEQAEYKQGIQIDSSLFLPAAGIRDGINATVNGVGLNGYCWSSTVGSTGSYTLIFYNATNVNVFDYGNRAGGMSVRCVADN